MTAKNAKMLYAMGTFEMRTLLLQRKPMAFVRAEVWAFAYYAVDSATPEERTIVADRVLQVAESRITLN